MSKILMPGDYMEPEKYAEFRVNQEYLIAKEILENGYTPVPMNEEMAQGI